MYVMNGAIFPNCYIIGREVPNRPPILKFPLKRPPVKPPQKWQKNCTVIGQVTNTSLNMYTYTLGIIIRLNKKNT